ncbi:uncharacterized protein K452DRAFT_58326 [Aplosporella prunicola CBS 121167]|uniref:Uncharacterized protein n=1 Tax=Aplosporella prunicola CBS 121167 TaxID=1176127 RepID=A0A6A6BAK1_9PEZI|nr:uncharacterized protein K452DRAFT_58326 [Aplosporella prunicola CBS 121167]KAF2139937.1 hypothetical protein K452DRAFT_58326 [Aplosporella prunicola CBS 121167]
MTHNPQDTTPPKTGELREVSTKVARYENRTRARQSGTTDAQVNAPSNGMAHSHNSRAPTCIAAPTQTVRAGRQEQEQQQQQQQQHRHHCPFHWACDAWSHVGMGGR